LKRVLVVSYGGAHVAVVIPLYQALTNAGLTPVMLGLTTAADVLRRHGIPIIRFLDHVDLQDKQVQRWGEYLCVFHHAEGSGISRSESLAYLGAGMAELVRDVGEQAALARYRAAGLNALLPVKLMLKILLAENIDAVIATDSPRAERATLNAAAQLSLPSVCVVSSFPDIGMHYLKRADNGAVMCVLNERFKDQLVAAGRAPSSVQATGNPAFDALIVPDAGPLRESLRTRSGLATNVWTVLWAEQPEPMDPTLPHRMRHELTEICAANGWRLVVRLHPSSQPADSIAIAGGMLLSPRTESVRDALLKSDAVVTFTSTIGFEALVLDKPVVVVAVSQYSNFVDYRDTDGVWVVNSMESVETALLGWFHNDTQARTLALNRRAFPRTGESARAIVDCLIRQQPPTPPQYPRNHEQS